jgi:hypothetical protein
MSNKYHRYRNKIYALPPHSFLTFEYEGLPHAAHLPRGDTPKGNLDGAPPLLGRLQKLGQIHPDVKAPRGSGDQYVVINYFCRTCLSKRLRTRGRRAGAAQAGIQNWAWTRFTGPPPGRTRRRGRRSPGPAGGGAPAGCGLRGGPRWRGRPRRRRLRWSLGQWFSKFLLECFLKFLVELTVRLI